LQGIGSLRYGVLFTRVEEHPIMSLGEFIPPLWITVLCSGLWIACCESLGRYIDDPRALDDNMSPFAVLSFCVGMLAFILSIIAVWSLVGWKPALAVFVIPICASFIYFQTSNVSQVVRALKRAARQGGLTPSDLADEMSLPPPAARKAIQLGFSFVVWPLVGALGLGLWLLYQQGVNR
jgi:hypothetical protein